MIGCRCGQDDDRMTWNVEVLVCLVFAKPSKL